MWSASIIESAVKGAFEHLDYPIVCIVEGQELGLAAVTEESQAVSVLTAWWTLENPAECMAWQSGVDLR